MQLRAAQQDAEVKAISAPSPSFTQLAFNLCNKKICPDAKYNPAVQDVTVRQAIAYAIDRKRIKRSARAGPRSWATACSPTSTSRSTPSRRRTTRSTSPRPTRCSTPRAGRSGSDGIRAKGGQKLSFDLFVRSESRSNIQDARLVAEMTKQIGVDFKVQIISVDKLTELTTQKVKRGKMAPDFDTFIWGWGGDPYDPGLLLNLLTTKAIGGSSDSFYSNPEYDRLYDQQTGEFDQAKSQGRSSRR